MKKLLCASVLLAFLLCGCQSAPASSSEASSAVASIPSVPDVVSSVDPVSELEPVSAVESVSESEPQESLVTVTIPAVVGDVDFSGMDIEAAKENWGFADASRNEDGSITFSMTEQLRDEFLQFTRESFVGGWFSTYLDNGNYAFVKSLTYDPVSNTAEILLKDGASYTDNNVWILAILVTFQNQVAAASEICGDFSVTVTVVGADGTVYDTYIAEPKDTDADTTETATEPIAEAQPETSSIPYEYQNALTKADKYLRYSSFSYTGLIDQLEYEGCTTEAATYAADNCGADWYEQASKTASDYLRYSAFSYSGLIDQLEYEGFTTEEATYAADNCGADWYEQAVEKAADYLGFSSFTRSSLISQLEFEGFTSDQAAYGASQNGL